MLATELRDYGIKCRSIAFDTIRAKRSMGFDVPHHMHIPIKELKDLSGAQRIHSDQFCNWLRALGATDVSADKVMVRFTFTSQAERTYH